MRVCIFRGVFTPVDQVLAWKWNCCSMVIAILDVCLRHHTLLWLQHARALEAQEALHVEEKSALQVRFEWVAVNRTSAISYYYQHSVVFHIRRTNVCAKGIGTPTSVANRPFKRLA